MSPDSEPPSRSGWPATLELSADGEGIDLEEVLTGRGFITGKSGSGKSNTASVIAEELLTVGLPLLIVDADGEYVGLKHSFDVLHAGATGECDVEVSPTEADTLASIALTEHVPVVLDLSGYFERGEAASVVAAVLRHLFELERTERKPFLIIVEEVHEFLPEQSGLDEVGEVLIQIAKRGRKRGLGICGLSQRPASVDKDYITQCDWLVWHRLTWESDVDVVRRILGQEYAEQVEELADGEGLVMTDWDDQVRRVQCRRKEVLDEGATPSLTGLESQEPQPTTEEAITLWEVGVEDENSARRESTSGETSEETYTDSQRRPNHQGESSVDSQPDLSLLEEATELIAHVLRRILRVSRREFSSLIQFLKK